jgi:hypothetical protein
MFRSVVYQRSKGDRDTVPYGTRVDFYRTGYEWIGYSMAALGGDEVTKDIRVTVGGEDCKQPYSASIFNISAMSFGALSKFFKYSSGKTRSPFFCTQLNLRTEDEINYATDAGFFFIFKA